MVGSRVDLGGTVLHRLGIGLTKIPQNEYSEQYRSRIQIVESLLSDGCKLFVDTSPIYSGGRSEVVAGRIKRDFRDNIFLATKYYPREGVEPDISVKEVRSSLKRMGIDSLDLLQIHWPNSLCHDEDVIATLTALKESGDVKEFGLSNFCAREVKEVLRQKSIDFKSCQIEANFGSLVPDFIQFDPLTKILYGLLLQGRLGPKGEAITTIERLSMNLGVDPSALVVSFFLQKARSSLAVLKISNPAHLKSVKKAIDLEISPQVFDCLDRLLVSTPKFIPPESVVLRGDQLRAPYLTVDEAISNKLDLIPSPLSLACRILKYQLIFPIKVNVMGDRYLVDDADPFDQIKKFWAWRLAYPLRRIPVIVLN